MEKEEKEIRREDERNVMCDIEYVMHSCILFASGVALSLRGKVRTGRTCEVRTEVRTVTRRNGISNLVENEKCESGRSGVVFVWDSHNSENK